MANGTVITPIDVKKRLEDLGYTVETDDESTIVYLIGAITNKIKLNTNYVEFPEELFHMAIDMICGEFLQTKYATGQLTGFDFTSAVKRITEGDTTVEYAYGSGSKTPEERFVAYLKVLRQADNDMLAAVRRLRW